MYQRKKRFRFSLDIVPLKVSINSTIFHLLILSLEQVSIYDDMCIFFERKLVSVSRNKSREMNKGRFFDTWPKIVNQETSKTLCILILLKGLNQEILVLPLLLIQESEGVSIWGLQVCYCDTFPDTKKGWCKDSLSQR